MVNSTLNKAIYSMLALSTSLAIGSSLLSKNLLTIAGTLSFCTTSSIALFNKDKKLLEQQEQANASFLESIKYTDDRYQALKVYFEEDYRELRQQLTRQQKRSVVQNSKTQRKVQSSCDKLIYRMTKAEDAIIQNSAKITAQTAEKKQVKPLQLKTIQQKKDRACSKILSHPPKTVVFIDQSNFYHSCENLKIEPDYGSLLCMLTPEEGSCEIRVYLGVYDRPSKKQQDLSKELKGLGYRVIELPIVVRQDESKKIVGDDIRLASDLQEMVSNGEITDRDRVVLVSSDGDFKPVLEKVKQQGISIDLIAYKPSQYLTPFVDRITYLDRIKYDICQIRKFDAA